MSLYSSIISPRNEGADGHLQPGNRNAVAPTHGEQTNILTTTCEPSYGISTGSETRIFRLVPERGRVSGPSSPCATRCFCLA